MATYVLPQVLVFQEFNIVPTADLRQLNAFIAGGHAYLSRLSESDEKALAYIGIYDDTGVAQSSGAFNGKTGVSYSWPSKPAGSKIDTAYTKLGIDGAMLKYSSATIQDAAWAKETGGSVEGRGRRIDINDEINLKSNASSSSARHADLKDRDVAVGDYVLVTGATTGGGTYDLCTTVTGVESVDDDRTAATAAPNATEASTNLAENATEDTTETPTAGSNSAASGKMDLTAATDAAFDGLSVGLSAETYTVTVTKANSVSGDVSDAEFRVTSASGKDDVFTLTSLSVAAGNKLGVLGGTFTVAGTNFFVVADTWTITFAPVYLPTQMSATSYASGFTAYTGTTDTTYVIEVTKGGRYSNSPEITVTTLDGSDSYPPQAVTAGGVNVAVGTKGILTAINDPGADAYGLSLGDKFTIAVTTEKDNDFRTLVLAHELPTDYSSVTDVKLFIKKDLQLDSHHINSGLTSPYNFQQNDDNIFVQSQITVYDETWTDGGAPQPLTVTSTPACAGTNLLYAEYRAWRSDLSVSVSSISDIANLNTAVEGVLHPDNELKWGLSKALTNNNSQPVKFAAVADPSSSTSWINVIDLIEDRTDVYGIVPLTRDATVLAAFQAHVQAVSNEIKGRWRVLWANIGTSQVLPVATSASSSDSADITATISDLSASGIYIYLQASSNSQFVTNGLKAGDTVRVNYVTDVWGDVSYTEYAVDSVLSENKLKLVSGEQITVATKVEVHRNLDLNSYSAQIGKAAGAYSDNRTRAVWPDTISTGSTSMKGYHLCAALAALSGGVVPHQGLTNLEVKGFSGLTRSTQFNRAHLDTMAASGTWIVTQDEKGNIYTRHGLTTGDQDNLNAREEMVIRNVDSISAFLLDRFAPYIGIANVTPGMIDIIEAETLSAIAHLRGSNHTPRLGGQLIDGKITDLRASVVHKDRIILALNMTIPYALNNLEVHLLV